MRYVDAEVQVCTNISTLTGEKKQNWILEKELKRVKLFDNVQSVKIVNGVKYEKADYIALTFDCSITKKIV